MKLTESLNQLLLVLGVLIGVVFFGSGGLPPAQTSLTPSSQYQITSFLQLITGFVLIAAAVSGSDVKYHVDVVGGLELVPNKERKMLRAILLIVFLYTMGTLLLARVTFLFVFQVKFSVWSCLPAYVKGSVIGVYIFVLTIRAGFHLCLARITICEV